MIHYYHPLIHILININSCVISLFSFKTKFKLVYNHLSSSFRSSSSVRSYVEFYVTDRWILLLIEELLSVVFIRCFLFLSKILPLLCSKKKILNHHIIKKNSNRKDVNPRTFKVQDNNGSIFVRNRKHSKMSTDDNGLTIKEE